MPANYKILQEKDYAESFGPTHAFALDILVGLSDKPKRIPSKYLYDENGSELFSEITFVPEYYLTDCEIDILSNQADKIIDTVKDEPFNLIELGAGFGRKTKILLEKFSEAKLDFQYVPIDISESAMIGLRDSMNESFPDIEVNGLVSDYFVGMKWFNERFTSRNLVTFLGSSIGNFNFAEARFFLRNVWTCLNRNDLFLIGFDLKKDIELLLSAYNDPQGITSRFNLNVLDRINKELGGQFDKSRFRHFGTYDVFSGAMESYLVSLESQEVPINQIGRSFHFDEWEPIHTEYSYKYLLSDIRELASDTGFSEVVNLFDSKKYFCDSIWRVNKS